MSILISALWGGLLALERRAFLQAALSRPLPAAVGVGALLGDVTSGLMVGLVFELFHLGGASLGGAHADHETLPAVAGAALAVSLGHASGSDATPAVWSLAILLCAPLGILGRRVDGRLDARARRYLGRLVDAVDSGTVEDAVRQNLRAMWPHFAFSALVCGAAVGTGTLLAAAEQALPASLVRGLAWAYPLLATVAAAVAVHASQGQGRLRIAAVVALVVALVLLGALGVRTWA
ncbi:MAG: PTS sugar transporter subunit IIC [Myxococcaceae bacterium]|nr:PTS sugar transporter subunit IIC [Myxococcaceae bacterium]